MEGQYRKRPLSTSRTTCVLAAVWSSASVATEPKCPRERWRATLQKPAASFDRLDVSTSTRGELVAEAMSQASTALLQTETEIQRIADLLTEGKKTARGCPPWGKCMSVWQQMNDAVNKSIQILELDAQKMLIGDEAMADILAKPMEVLLQVKQALESKDYVLLADTLQYEFGDVTQQWHSVIAEIRREARTTPRRNGRSYLKRPRYSAAGYLTAFFFILSASAEGKVNLHPAGKGQHIRENICQLLANLGDLIRIIMNGRQLIRAEPLKMLHQLGRLDCN